MPRWLNWFQPPQLDDESTTMQARSLHFAQLIALGTATIVGVITIFSHSVENITLVGIAFPIIIASIWLLRSGHLRSASILFMLLVVGLVTLSQINSDEGIHSAATLIYPMFLILASRFLSRRETIIVTLLMLASTGIVAYLEISGTIATLYTINKPKAVVEDIFIISLFIIVSAIASRLTIENLFSSIERANKNEERYRLISDITSDYVFQSTIKPSGTLSNLWVAGAFEKVTGYSPKEFDERGGWRSIVHPEDLSQDDQDLSDLRAKKRIDSRLRIITKQGDICWVRIVARPIWDEQENKLAGIYGAVQNITLQKNAEAEITHLNTSLEKRVEERTADLQAALNELEEFSYTISHDLRAPLRAVSGYAGILLNDHRDTLEELSLRNIKLIETNARRMGVMIDGLLAFLHLNRKTMSKEPIQTEKLVRRAIQFFEPETIGRNIDIQVGELPFCYADADLLAQVFRSLIGNAIKYTRDRDPAILEIGANEQDGRTVYFVRDNGIGFDMQYQSKLFGVFQKLHQVEEFEGEGLSLAIVHRIIQRHGGTIWAEAEVGKGATFYFTLE